jgi:hypothetical protein
MLWTQSAHVGFWRKRATPPSVSRDFLPVSPLQVGGQRFYCEFGPELGAYTTDFATHWSLKIAPGVDAYADLRKRVSERLSTTEPETGRRQRPHKEIPRVWYATGREIAEAWIAPAKFRSRST